MRPKVKYSSYYVWYLLKKVFIKTLIFKMVRWKDSLKWFRDIDGSDSWPAISKHLLDLLQQRLWSKNLIMVVVDL